MWNPSFSPSKSWHRHVYQKVWNLGPCSRNLPTTLLHCCLGDSKTDYPIDEPNYINPLKVIFSNWLQKGKSEIWRTRRFRVPCWLAGGEGCKQGMQVHLEAESSSWLKPSKETETSVLKLPGTEFVHFFINVMPVSFAFVNYSVFICRLWQYFAFEI